MGLRRGCDQSKHTFNYHSANTYEDLWLRVSRKSVVAVPMEVAPRARSCRVKGQRTFNRMRQPQNTSLHDFYLFYPKLLERSKSFFQYRQCIVLSNYIWCRCSQFSTLQQAKLYSCSLHRWTLIIFLLSELSVKKLTISSQSSESRKIRGEADAISTQRPLLCLNSHIFFFVVDQRKRRQRQASKTADVCSAFEPQLTAKIIDVHIQARHIYSIVARSESLYKLPVWASNQQKLFTCDSNHYFIYLSQSIHAETPFVRAVNARRFNSGYTCSYLPIILLAEPLIGLSTSGSLEVIQDLPMITDQEYSSHCRRKIRALYAKVHLNFSRKVQPLFYFVHTGFGYKLATDRTTIYFYSWNQHHRANFITYSFFIRSYSIQIHYIVYSLINHDMCAAEKRTVM